MANRFWVGGAGNWDQSSTTNWSDTSGGTGGQSVPTSADDVFFDAGSGTGIVTITENAPALSLTTTGYSGTLAFSPTVVLTIDSNVTVAATTTITPSTGRITMSGVGVTFAGGGKSYYDVQVSGNVTITGTNTFANNFSSSNTTAHTITWPTGTTTFGNVSISGSASNFVTHSGTTATFVLSSGGRITADYWDVAISITGSPAVVSNKYTWGVGWNSKIQKATPTTNVVCAPQNTVVTLLTSGTSYTIPVDWRPNSNRVFLIGGGGGSASTAQVSQPAPGTGRKGIASSGGGGGGFTLLSNYNVNAGTVVGIGIGAGGTTGNTTAPTSPFRLQATSGGTTTFGPSTAGGGGGSFVTRGPSAGYANVAAGSGGAGGSGATFNGGSGGFSGGGTTNNPLTIGSGGGGGGGAGGPLGTGGSGNAGGSGTSPTTYGGGGGGGAGSGGTNGTAGGSPAVGTGGTNTYSNNGGNGNASATTTGRNILGLFGSGGGGGGGSNQTIGLGGGIYGGGAGGSGQQSGSTTRSGASGGAGVIVVAYEAYNILTTAYWVGGSNTWSTGTVSNWASTSGGPGGAGIVTNATDVIVDANSGSPTITLLGALQCKSLNTTGSTCTIAGTGSLTVGGNITLSSTTTWTATGTLLVAASSVLTTNEISIASPITFSTVAGTFTLNSNLVTTNTATLTFGTLNLNSYTFSASNLFSSGTSTRAIQFNNGEIVLSAGNTTVWNVQTSTGFTYTGTPKVISTFAGPTGTRTFEFGNTATNLLYNVVANGSSGIILAPNNPSDNIRITGSLNALDLEGFSGRLTIGSGVINTTTSGPGSFANVQGNLILSSTMADTGAITSNSALFFGNTTGRQFVTSSGKEIAAPVRVSSNVLIFTDSFYQNTAPLDDEFRLFSGINRIDLNSNTHYVRRISLADGAGSNTTVFANGVIVTTQGLQGANTVILESANLIANGAYVFNRGKLELGNNNTLQATSVFDTLGSAEYINFGQNSQILLTGTGQIWNFTAIATQYRGTPRIISTDSSSLAKTAGFATNAGGGALSSAGLNVSANADTGFILSRNNPTGTITLNGTIRSLNLESLSGNFTVATSNLNVSGNLIVGTTTSFAGSTGALVFFGQTSGNYSIETANTTFPFTLAFNTGIGNPAVYNLTGNLNNSVSNTTQFINGTLNLNDHILSTGAVGIFNSGGSRINFANNSFVNVTGNSRAIWSGATTTQFSTVGKPDVYFTHTGATGTRTIVHGTTGGSIVTANVNFNIPSGTDIIDITTGSQMNDLNFTGFSGTFAPAAAYTLYGNLIASSAMTWTTGTGTITFASTSNNRTITTANKTLRNVTFNGLGGRWALQDNLTLSSILAVTSGTLNLNNFNANTLTFTGTGTSARGIIFGTSNVNITSTATATVLDLTNATGFTPSGIGGFRLTGAAASAITRTAVIGTTGGSANTAPNLNVGAGAAGSIFALTTGSWVQDLNFTGFSGTFAPQASTTITGNLIAVPAMTWTTGTGTTTFASTSNNRTITTAGKTLYNTVFNGVGGEWLLQDNLTLSNIFTFTNGTLNSNTVNVAALTFAFSNGTIDMGSSNWRTTSTGAATVWNNSNTTFIANTSTINIAGASGVNTVTFVGGGKTYNNLIFTSAAATGAIVFNGNNTFNEVSTLRTGAYTVSLSPGLTTTVNKWGIVGSASGRVTLNSPVSGAAAGLSQSTGTVSGEWLTIRDSVAFGGATFDGRFATTINSGGNSGWLFNDMQRYWVGGADVWDNTAGTKWALTSGGTGGASVPTWMNDVFFDANSGVDTVTISAANSQNLSFTDFGGSISVTTWPSLYGSLVLTPSIANNYTGTLSFIANTSAFIRDIDVPTTTLPNSLTLNGTNGVWAFDNNFSTTNTITLVAGTLISNNKNITANNFATSGAVSKNLIMNAATTFTITSNIGTVWDAQTGTTGLTVTSAPDSTIDISSNNNNAITFAGGGKTYGKLLFSNTASNGTITITGSNYFRTLQSQRTTSYILDLTSATTTNVANWFISGSANTFVTVGPSSGTATLTRDVSANGTISANWLILRNISATPAVSLSATPVTFNWCLGANSTFGKANNVSGVALLNTPKKIAAITSVGSSNWSVPLDWNPNDNQVVLVGGGGGGSAAIASPNSPSANEFYTSGAGGGGGGLRIVTNYTAAGGTTIPYTVGSGGTAGPAQSGNPPSATDSIAGSGGTTSFGPQSATGGGGGISTIRRSQPVSPFASIPGVTTGGTAGTGTYSGGVGGSATNGPYVIRGAAGGSGGGGAAGLTSNGGAGGRASTNTFTSPTNPAQPNQMGSGGGGAGGATVNGTDATRGPSLPAPYNGIGGTTLFGGDGTNGGSNSVGGPNGRNLWGLYGSGGGAGGSSGGAGINGGLYGGGGSGGRFNAPGSGSVSSAPGGIGSQGIILIAYTPYVEPPPASNNNSGMFLII